MPSIVPIPYSITSINHIVNHYQPFFHQSHSCLVGGPGPPLWKIWVRQLRDDNRNPRFLGKLKIDVPTSHHQPVIIFSWPRIWIGGFPKTSGLPRPARGSPTSVPGAGDRLPSTCQGWPALRKTSENMGIWGWWTRPRASWTKYHKLSSQITIFLTTCDQKFYVEFRNTTPRVK